MINKIKSSMKKIVKNNKFTLENSEAFKIYQYSMRKQEIFKIYELFLIKDNVKISA